LEMLVLIPAWTKLFYGLTQLGYRHSNTAVFGKDRTKKSKTDQIRNLTVAFVSVKSVLSFLPEFADLSNSSYDESTGMVNLYRYIGIMRMLAFIPVLIVGVIWLWRAIRYFHSLRHDTAFTEELEQRYTTDILPKKGLFARRAVHLLSFVLLTALCLTADLRLEYRNMVPDFLAAIAFFVLLSILVKRLKLSVTAGWVSCSAYLACTLFSYGAEWHFFNEFTYNAIRRSNEARDAYLWVIVSTFLKAIVFLVLIWFLIQGLR